jgi:VanZ family protein
MKIRTIFQILFYLLLIFITVNSVLPDEEAYLHESMKLTQSGFFLHLGAYLVAFVAGCLGYCSKNKKVLLYLFIFVLAYSILLEIVQYFLPTRSFNWLDILANGVGVVIGMPVASFLIGRKRLRD